MAEKKDGRMQKKTKVAENLINIKNQVCVIYQR